MSTLDKNSPKQEVSTLKLAVTSFKLLIDN